jgi:hypothetical protein
MPEFRDIVHRSFLTKLHDNQPLKWQYPLFDTLYRYCQEQRTENES